MKNVVILLIVISFLSCKNEVSDSKKKSETPIDLTGQKTTEPEKFLQIDTLKTEKLETLNLVDKILVKTLRKEFSKDSLGTAFFRLDFYCKDRLVKSFPASVKYGSEEGEWDLSEEVFSTEKNKKTDNHFIELSYGYPACGYIHTNYLFFIDENNFQLVAKNDSMMDSGFGSYTAYDTIFQNKKLISFTSKVVQVDSDDSKSYNEENESMVIRFSDSIVYTKQSNEWVGKLKTTKGKVFRQVFTTFQEYYK